MSFSALLFGPFYFFYRKAWKPAFGFLAAELLLFIPTLISMMPVSYTHLMLLRPFRARNVPVPAWFVQKYRSLVSGR